MSSRSNGSAVPPRVSASAAARRRSHRCQARRACPCACRSAPSGSRAWRTRRTLLWASLEPVERRLLFAPRCCAQSPRISRNRAAGGGRQIAPADARSPGAVRWPRGSQLPITGELLVLRRRRGRRQHRRRPLGLQQADDGVVALPPEEPRLGRQRLGHQLAVQQCDLTGQVSRDQSSSVEAGTAGAVTSHAGEKTFASTASALSPTARDAAAQSQPVQA